MNELGCRFSFGLIALTLSLAACGEGGADGSGGDPNDGSTSTAASGDTVGSTTTSGTTSSAASTSASGGGSSTSSASSGSSSSSGEGGATSASSGSAGGEPAGLLVINELSADGDDWIELFNAGDGEIDLSGLRVADQEEPGIPKLADAMAFPDGTMLEAGAYLFILADQDVPVEGFTDVCAPGPAPCLQAGFGLSQGNGDEVFVVDADDAIVLSSPYPADAAVVGESWGRLPDGTGEFTVTAPTPGATNEAL